MKKKYTAFVVYNGAGDDYVKHSVHWTKEAAERDAAELGASVWQTGFDSKYALETLIEDDLTDGQADLFLTENL
jgi:hypothetical protein